MPDIQLHNGDCMEVMKSIPDASIDAIISDPPYAMTACGWDTPISPLFWDEIKRVRKPTANIVLFSKQPFTTVLNNGNLDEFKYELIWLKQQATNPMCAKKRVMPIHENISIFYKEFGTYNPQMQYGFSNYIGFKDEEKLIGEIYSDKVKSIHRDCSDGSRYPTSVLKYNNVRKNALHPTQKPLDLMEFLVKSYTNEGDLVLDATMGAGSTGIACRRLNRRFIGIEKEQKYFDIAKRRIEEVEREQENDSK